MPQRHQRVRARCAPGRNDAGDDHAAHDDRQRTREGEGVGSAHAVEHADEKPAGAQCRDGAECGTRRAEPQASTQESANGRFSQDRIDTLLLLGSRRSYSARSASVGLIREAYLAGM